VRLEMNSLHRKRDDIFRQLINEPAFDSPDYLLLEIKWLRKAWVSLAAEMITNGQSLNHSYASGLLCPLRLNLQPMKN
jgi:hypothetical protein